MVFFYFELKLQELHTTTAVSNRDVFKTTSSVIMVRTQTLNTNFCVAWHNMPPPLYDKGFNAGFHLLVDELSGLRSYLSRSDIVIIAKQLNSVACKALSVVCRFFFYPWKGYIIWQFRICSARMKENRCFGKIQICHCYRSKRTN